jgi:hypothetical protein
MPKSPQDIYLATALSPHKLIGLLLFRFRLRFSAAGVWVHRRCTFLGQVGFFSHATLVNRSWISRS